MRKEFPSNDIDYTKVPFETVIDTNIKNGMIRVMVPHGVNKQHEAVKGLIQVDNMQPHPQYAMLNILAFSTTNINVALSTIQSKKHTQRATLLTEKLASLKNTPTIRAIFQDFQDSFRIHGQKPEENVEFSWHSLHYDEEGRITTISTSSFVSRHKAEGYFLDLIETIISKVSH